MGNVIVFDHPLIQHKISIMRSINTSCKEFRELVKEVTMFMCYESLRDMPLKEVEVTTPITTCKTQILAGPEMAVVPILRAGLGMVEGVLELVPTAKVGHIGLYRDEVTMKPHEYYCKLPPNIGERKIIVTDPMLATGGSAVAAINFIKERGGKDIKFMCMIAAPEGIEVLLNAHPDVDIYCAHKDEGLNSACYIVPGLGDAGDRIFGTK
ncbi:MAG: uracil phosphoribosyltransferase [Clostridia bacterium]|nr:uracil phosphoribosyltransferase [Clostridia bacterium]